MVPTGRGSDGVEQSAGHTHLHTPLETVFERLRKTPLDFLRFSVRMAPASPLPYARWSGGSVWTWFT